jgi:hypothetical protein
MDIVTQSGIAYARIGDCNVPGDFLTGIRDAGMVAMSVDNYARRQAFDNVLKV